MPTRPVLLSRPAYRTAALALVASLLLSGCKEDLYAELDEDDATRIHAALLANGIDSEKFAGRNGTYGVRTSRDEVPTAVRVLDDCGLPRNRFASMGELFKKSGLISSPLEERARFIFANAQSLSETLSEIDGAVFARVHIVLPENNPFSDNVEPSSASVFIKHRGDRDLQALKSEIKRLVHSAVEGLAYEEVAVALFRAADNNACMGSATGRDGGQLANNGWGR